MLEATLQLMLISMDSLPGGAGEGKEHYLLIGRLGGTRLNTRLLLLTNRSIYLSF